LRGDLGFLDERVGEAGGGEVRPSAAPSVTFVVQVSWNVERAGRVTIGVDSSFAEVVARFEPLMAAIVVPPMASDGLRAPLNGDLKGLNRAEDVLRRLPAGVEQGSSPSGGAEDMPAGVRCRRFMHWGCNRDGLAVLWSPWHDTCTVVEAWGEVGRG